MDNKPFQVKFENRENPRSTFDLLKLQDLFQRTDIAHDFEKLHKVDFFLILFIQEGRGLHTIDFKDYDLEKGTLLTIRKDQIHRFTKNGQIKGFSLLFTNEFLVSYLEKLEAQKSLQLFNELLGVPKIQLDQDDFEVINELIAGMEEEYFTIKDTYSLGIIRSQLHILITKLYRIKSRNSSLTINKKYLSSFIDFQKLVEEKAFITNSVADYAKLMLISTKTLNTISKSIINRTAKDFIDEIKIKQIKRLLINTTLPIKEIAYTTGFNETTNFYKYFKRLAGVTPESFRAIF